MYMPRIELRKGIERIYVEYEAGYGYADLLVKDFFAFIDNGILHISMDLIINLKSRDKELNTYIDANNLLENINKFKSLSTNDDYVIKHLSRFINNHPEVANYWKLIINLKGEHTFKVKYDYKRQCALNTLSLIAI